MLLCRVFFSLCSDFICLAIDGESVRETGRSNLYIARVLDSSTRTIVIKRYVAGVLIYTLARYSVILIEIDLRHLISLRTYRSLGDTILP